MKAAVKTTQGQNVCWWGERAAGLEGRGEDFSAALRRVGRAGEGIQPSVLGGHGPCLALLRLGVPAPSWCSSLLCPTPAAQ